jgi:hypothetical protein
MSQRLLINIHVVLTPTFSYERLRLTSPYTYFQFRAMCQSDGELVRKTAEIYWKASPGKLRNGA